MPCSNCAARDVYLAPADMTMRCTGWMKTVVGGGREHFVTVSHFLAGRRREAEEVRRDLIDRAATSDQVASSIAMVETALGNHTAAVEWLNRAFDARSASIFLVNGELKFDPLRPDARFQDLLRRMHFPAE